MKNNNVRLINRRNFVQTTACAALLSHNLLSATEQFMAPSQWHGVGPASSDGTMFVVGNTFKNSAFCEWLPWHQTYIDSVDVVFITSLHGHNLQANMQYLAQQSNLLTVAVSDPGYNALIGFNDLAHAFDQQIIGTDFEDLVSFCSHFGNDQATVRIGVGTSQGEQAGHQALLVALLDIQTLNGQQLAFAGPAIMIIAANVGTLRIKMVRDLCSQLKSTSLGYSDTIVTLAVDDAMPDQAIRVTLLARRKSVFERRR